MTSPAPAAAPAPGGARRPLKSRDSAWAGALARFLTRAGVPPDGISAASLLFAGGAGASFLAVPGAAPGWRSLAFLGAAAGIQLRLLCNLLDGMVAVEGGRGSAAGAVWNEVPDRFADLLIIVPAGYAVTGWPLAHELGWLAGALAVAAASVRLLGGSLGVRQDFSGPMAKPHRMALLTGTSVVCAAVSPFREPGALLYAALLIMASGTLLTIARRLARLTRALRGR